MVTAAPPTAPGSAETSPYPYLDLAVMDALRGHIVSPNAALVFSPDLSEIWWANAAGVALVGADSIRDALEGDAGLSSVMRRQIEAAVRKLDDATTSTAVMRVSRGLKTSLLGFTVSHIALPRGDQAVMLLTEALDTRRRSEDERAQAAVDALAGYGSAAAVLGADGQIIRASDTFDALDVDGDELGALCIEVATEDDRLVKRTVRSGSGESPAGIARLREDPAVHLLVIASDEGEREEAVVDETRSAIVEEENLPDTAPGLVPAASVSPRATAPLRHWYFNAQKQTTADDEADDDLTPREGTLVFETAEDVTIPLAAMSDASARPVRFVWDMDAEKRFGSASLELSETVGRESGNIAGATWLDVSSRLGFENGHEIEALIDKGDTWSGKTVLWPVDGTDLRVPVDLAGLPAYGRDRTFEGFNGFGIIRLADAAGAETEIAENVGGLTPDERESFEEIGERLSEDGEDAGAGVAAVATLALGAAILVGNEDETPADEPTLARRDDESTADATAVDEQTSIEDEAAEESELAASDAEDEVAAVGFLPSAFNNRRRAEGTSGPSTETEAETETDFIERTGETPDDVSDSAPAENTPVVEDVTAKFTDDADVPEALDTSSQNGVIRVPNHEIDTSILARLPIPVLVYRDDELLFANPDFTNVTGYRDLAELAEAGGVERLFGGPDDRLTGDSASPIFHANGDRLPVRAHIQKVPWDAKPAMLLTLRPGQGRDDGPVDNTPRSDGGGPRFSLVQGGASGDASASFGGLDASELRGIVDTASDGVLILSPKGTVQAASRSAEALFDRPAHEIEGSELASLLAPESRDAARDYLDSLRQPGLARLLNDGREFMLRTPRGGLVPVFMTIGPLGESTDRFCAVMRDITPWKRSEEDLLRAKASAEEASQQKSHFLARISHEIRTPLNAIIGFSDMMVAERFGRIESDRYRGYLRDISRSGQHVLEIVNDLLDISKIEAGQLDLTFDSCDLNTIVSNTVALMQADANKDRVIIRTSLSAAVPKVVADPRSLRQVILNLVSNGIKYTRAGGQVIVSTVLDEGGAVTLRVRDTGIGMSDADLEQALQPFQRITTTPPIDRAPEGTGLGLPLTRALVEANRAQFHIESEPEEGTLVEVRFETQRVLADR